MPSQNHSDPSIFSTFGAKLLLRAGGHCECVSSCGHHPPDSCGSTLLNGLWRIGLIVPATPDGFGTMGNSEALCEPCKLALGKIENAATWRPQFGSKN